MLKKISNFFVWLLVICMTVAITATGCSQQGGYEGPKSVTPPDPSRPVIFTGFSPKEGSRTYASLFRRKQLRYGCLEN